MTFVRNAWMDKNGTVHEVEDCGHSAYAYNELGDVSWGDGLEMSGWLHLSVNAGRWIRNMFGHRPTQAQLDVLWDMYMDIRDSFSRDVNFAKEDLMKVLNINSED